MRNLGKSYQDFLADLKLRIVSSRSNISRTVNTELVLLYWDIGHLILKKTLKEAWGSGVVEKIAKDLQGSFPEMKGFGHRNLMYMRQFAEEWPDRSIVQQLVAQLPWGHNLLILQKISLEADRVWYIQKALENGWSRGVLIMQIESDLKRRLDSGAKAHNFEATLPKVRSDFAKNVLKDPYIFDFLSIGEEAYEREIEKKLVEHIQKFLLELGAGFAFVGRQVQLSIGNKDYFIDLLFYHTKLHCYIVIELKASEFEPEYAGKLNFYLSAVDDIIKSKKDGPTIGILLCKSKDKITAEYALKDISKPMGISDYKISNAIPEKIKSALPSIEELEEELGRND